MNKIKDRVILKYKNAYLHATKGWRGNKKDITEFKNMLKK